MEAGGEGVLAVLGSGRPIFGGGKEEGSSSGRIVRIGGNWRGGENAPRNDDGIRNEGGVTK